MIAIIFWHFPRLSVFLHTNNSTNMNIKKFVTLVLLFITAATTQAQQYPLPVDPAIRMGQLDNGLKYYVRQNGYPEHRVNFYIAQRVGSIQENEDQRGLAHFLEHMAFNGSDNFKGNNLIEYTRSLGVEFGGDLNAYTGIDQTVYRICNVPSTRVSALDSCLLILKDWSNGLLLEEDEIQKERGVIHEEWRLRTSPIMRMLERNLEALYPDSKYGRRMPIGKMEIVDNFAPEVLRAYYRKWYRPDNQAIIVVGDIDVDRTEAKIKEMFSGIKVPAGAPKVVPEPVPDNSKPIIIIDKDKEQRTDMIEVMFKHEVETAEEKSDLSYVLGEYAKRMVVSMLDNRLTEVAQEPDCPFLNAGVGDGAFFLAHTKGAFELSVVPKEGKHEEALAAAYREVERALQHGFTATEYARARAEFLSQVDKVYTNRDKRDNSVYGDACRDHFLENEPLMAIDAEKQIYDQFAPMVPVEMVNEVLGELVSRTDTNVVVLCLNNEKEGKTYPTAAGLYQAITSVRGQTLTPWVDNVKEEPLISEMPAKGSIVSESKNDQLGFTQLQLSNGAKVLMKKTDFKDDEVRMYAFSKGGASLYPESDIFNTSLLGSVVGMSGLGAFNSTELDKALAGKQASVSMSLTDTHEQMSGSCAPKDLETMFQLCYLKFTSITKDEKSFATLMGMLENQLKNKDQSPEVAFSDSIRVTLYDRNPRFMSMNVGDLAKVNYDRILQIAAERTANAGDYTFIFVGNYDEAQLRQMIEQYVASLPDNGQRDQWRPVTTYAQGKKVNRFLRKMETPKANSRLVWFNDTAPYTQEGDVLVSAAGQVLEMIYLKKIREEASAAYSASAGGYSVLGGDKPFTALVGVCPMKPEQADQALAIMRDEAQRLCSDVDADMLGKVKELMLKQADDDARKNGYWINVLEAYAEHGIDLHTNYKNIINGVTPQKVASFVKDVVMKPGNQVEVVMLPE
jgi:zinc protease